MAGLQSYFDQIYSAAIEEKVPDVNAKLIISQAENESGQFTSHLFLQDNNAFGMKIPTLRKSKHIAGPSTIVMTSEGTTPYAHYNSLSDSAKDMIDWLKYHNIKWGQVNTPETYAAFLKTYGYYGDTQEAYTSNVSRYYNQIKDDVFNIISHNPELSIATGVSILGLITFYVIKIAKNKK